MLDTGAGVTIVSRQWYENNKKRLPHLSPSNLRLRTANGAVVQAVGTLRNVNIILNDSRTTANITVIPGKAANLLGLDVMRKLGTTIKLTKERCSFDTEKKEVTPPQMCYAQTTLTLPPHATRETQLRTTIEDGTGLLEGEFINDGVVEIKNHSITAWVTNTTDHELIIPAGKHVADIHTSIDVSSAIPVEPKQA